MSIATRIPAGHSQTTHLQGQVERSPEPYFSPPKPLGMREPGTNWITIVTAPGPHTTETPGGGPGGAPARANYNMAGPVPMLTRKGG